MNSNGISFTTNKVRSTNKSTTFGKCCVHRKKTMACLVWTHDFNEMSFFVFHWKCSLSPGVSPVNLTLFSYLCNMSRGYLFNVEKLG